MRVGFRMFFGAVGLGKVALEGRQGSLRGERGKSGDGAGQGGDLGIIIGYE